MQLTKDRTQEIKQELAELKIIKERVKTHKRNLHKLGFTFKHGNEYEVQDRLELYFINNNIPYFKEVKVKNGRIDFLTDTEIIEVKKLWQSSHIFNAIGQLIYYNKLHNYKYKMVVCADNFSDSQKEILQSLNIEARII